MGAGGQAGVHSLPLFHCERQNARLTVSSCGARYKLINGPMPPPGLARKARSTVELNGPCLGCPIGAAHAKGERTPVSVPVPPALAPPVVDKRDKRDTRPTESDPAPILTANQRRYQRLRARGLCACGRRALPGRATCGGHPRSVRPRAPAGNCHNHPRRAAVGGRCEQCLATHRAVAKRRSARFRAQGRCQVCGSDSGGASRCKRCRRPARPCKSAAA